MMTHSMGGLPVFLCAMRSQGAVWPPFSRASPTPSLTAPNIFLAVLQRLHSPSTGVVEAFQGRQRGGWWEQSWRQHDRAPSATLCCLHVDR